MSFSIIKRALMFGIVGLMIFIVSGDEVNGQSRRQIERERERERIERRQRRVRNYRDVEIRINNANYRTGYEQGFLAGEYDRRKRKYNQSNVYRGTGSAPYSGDPTSFDYIYRQGYLQGYHDAYYGRPGNY